MSCTSIMYVDYHISWYSEPVSVTYPVPQEAIDARPDTFILHFLLGCHMSTVRAVLMSLLSFFPSAIR